MGEIQRAKHKWVRVWSQGPGNRLSPRRTGFFWLIVIVSRVFQILINWPWPVAEAIWKMEPARMSGTACSRHGMFSDVPRIWAKREKTVGT